VSPPPHPVDWWAGIAAASITELAQVSLGLAGVEPSPHTVELPRQRDGSIISLVGDQESLEIGLFSDTEGCRSLASRMLGMEPEGEEMVVDAMCELANVLAGLTKRKLAAADAKFEIGLPLYVRGSIAVGDAAEAVSIPVRLGNAGVEVVVLRNLNPAPSGGSHAAASAR